MRTGLGRFKKDVKLPDGRVWYANQAMTIQARDEYRAKARKRAKKYNAAKSKKKYDAAQRRSAEK